MSGSNGTVHVAAEMREPIRPLQAAEMSSQQRNALLDELVTVVNSNARALQELRRVLEQQAGACESRYNASRLLIGTGANAHAEFTARAFWSRLRWIVTGR